MSAQSALPSILICVCLTAFIYEEFKSNFEVINFQSLELLKFKRVSVDASDYETVEVLDEPTQLLVGESPDFAILAQKDSLRPVFDFSPHLAKSVVVTQSDIEIFNAVARYADEEQLYLQSIGEAIQKLAKYFENAPYKAYQLDQGSQETLFVTLQNFDCVIFIETIIALARGFLVEDYTPQSFFENIREQRYQNALDGGYCSRLHYFTHWIQENSRRRAVDQLFSLLNSVSIQKNLNFMTTHREAYPQLVNNENNYRCISQMEARLSPVDITYIPQTKIREAYNDLQAGDIIAVVTSIEGLDVSHTGFVYTSDEGNVGLIHSNIHGVRVESDLQAYVGNIPHALGVAFARPLDFR